MLCLKTLIKSQFQNPKFNLPISHIHNQSSKNPSLYNPAIQFILDEVKETQSSKPIFNPPVQNDEERDSVSSKIQISHPWSEWVGLMERLSKDGYFDEIGNPFASPNRELGNKEANLIRTASLNFARDHYQLIRYLSRKDIMVIAGPGCPSVDRKVVNSGKRLRAHVGINEGNVCSSCTLRGDCDRAYIKARDDEGGRTVDVMRFLLTYGLDPVIGSVENKPCLNKRVKESVRMLLKEMVEIRVEGGDDLERPKAITRERASLTRENEVQRERARIDVPMKQGDWICPKCNFFNFARNVKCLRCEGYSEERLRKVAEEQDNLPLKKGDWICDKCKFLNFARNTKCLQCKEKPPKRQINPGEWECESCNYINFRRNMVCLKCDHKRPIASHPVNNDNLNSRQTRPWFGQEKKSKYDGEGFLEFVEDGSEDNVSSMNLMHFPVVGGKSEFSRDVKKQELWKMEMIGESKKIDDEEDDDSDSDDDDDDDDMAEWFVGVKKSR
ncbi:hypothetical protein CASFOL_020495 [Castilleja foliolosa]|uniref:RanBP2-type domain-containing protein n=1 Tax=Castilleja foliolosa TaxID=1961234 RepID=A0ABD3D108_9LAMI